MTKIEFKADEFLVDPPHHLVVNLIGAGGTGSQVASILARMNIALKSLGHPGFHVQIYDFDTVSTSNVGRQLYSIQEVGMNKAEALTNRLNRFFGTSWTYVRGKFHYETNKPYSVGECPNIVISCVDTVKARKEIQSVVHNLRTKARYGQELVLDRFPFVWLDFGNGKNYGQAILNYKNDSVETPDFFFLNPGIEHEPESNEPSCSLAAALEHQDLLVNSTLANLGMDILWKIFRTKKVSHTGVFLNLENLKVNSVKLKPRKNEQNERRV